jgi:cytohesin
MAAVWLFAVLIACCSVISYCVDIQGDLQYQDILKAVREDDMGRLEWLLAEGVNPDFFNENGDRWTPLIFAVNKGKLDFVDRLLKARANPNQSERDGWTPLHFAAAFGHITIARALIEAGGDVNIKTVASKTAVDLAKEYKKWDVLETLEVAKRTNIPSRKAREQYLANLDAAQNPDTSAQGIDAINMFMKFAENGPTRDLSNMLQTKAVNVNAKTADGRTALHRAAFSGNMERIQMLVTSGAYVNELDTQSWSALMFAASNVRRSALLQIFDMIICSLTCLCFCVCLHP